MMKAWVLQGIDDIRLEDVEVPVTIPGEVSIRVEAAGVCGSDIPRIYETGAHRMPLIPGHEFSGVVDGIGKNVPSWLMGKRVGVYPLISCNKCKPCMTGHPEMCRNYDYIGSRRDGAFAENVNVPASNLIELLESVSFEEAAMLEPMAVAVHAMRMALESGAPVNRDARIAVCGLGTIGLLLCMFLLERGYENLYVIGNKESQKKRALALGIQEGNYCDSSSVDAAGWIAEKTGGADVYFECVGRNESLMYGIDSALPGGTVILVGNPFSDMMLERDVYWKILRNQLTVKGTWNSTFLNGDFSDTNPDDWHYVMKRLSEGKVMPKQLITHRLPLSGLEDGFRIMRDKKEDYCKVMMVRNA